MNKKVDTITFVIGILYSTQLNKAVGYRILTMNTDFYKSSQEVYVNDYSEEDLKKRASFFNFGNIEIVNGKIIPTQGIFNRYPKIEAETGDLLGEPSIVILGKDFVGHYFVVDNPYLPYSDGNERRMLRIVSPYELKKQIKFKGFSITNGKRVANAYVTNPDDVKASIITPIKGEFRCLANEPEKFVKVFDLAEEQLKVFSPTWKVTIVRKGDRWGEDYTMLHNNEKPIITFTDMTQDKEKFPGGQFVGSYYLEEFMRDCMGLRLSSSNRWCLTDKSILKIQDWVNTLKIV